MTALRLPMKPTPDADHGRALVRIPADRMHEAGLSAGDAVVVRIDAETHGRAIPGPAGANAIELDPMLADRIGGAWGDMVEFTRVELRPLTSVIVRVDGEDIPSPADLSEALFDLPLREGDRLVLPLPQARSAEITIEATDPTPAGRFTQETALSISGRPDAVPIYSGIGGLEEQVARVHEMVATPLQRPDLFDRLGISPPRGILFTGPPGSGKTLLARAVAARTSAAFFHINGPEIVSKHYGDSEAALRKVFAAAAREAPAIIFIDEIDAVAPRREGLSDEKQVERRIVAQLLTLMDGMSERGRIVVMAATNLPDALDPALRRPGRFDREISFRPPDARQRREILAVHLNDAPLDQTIDLDAIAESCPGYVGADLAAVAREAALASLTRHVAAAGDEARVVASDLFISQRDLLTGLAATQPSILRDTVVETPMIGWGAIGGLDEVKEALHEAVLMPINHRQMFEQLRLSPARGILLSGPPGSGKTLLARALAGESGMNFVAVRPTRILSQYLGEAERAVADTFSKARHAAPALLFFDELDALAGKRGSHDAVQDRIIAQLLIEMDGMAPNENVVVLGATNRAAAIDAALLRPGRFDLVVPVPLPDATGRQAILDVHCKDLPMANDIEREGLAKQLKGYSGADIAALVKAASRHALRRGLATGDTNPSVRSSDFELAIKAHEMGQGEVARDFIKSPTDGATS